MDRTELSLQHRSAIRLADLGFWVFPIVSGHKSPPAIKEWQHAATRDYGIINTWWTTNPQYNIGIYTGKYQQGDEALIVIDVDTKQGGKGDDTLLALELEGYDVPDTYVQITPTGGRHVVLRTRQAVRSGASVLGPNLDIRSSGGYIVGAGSVTDRGTYRACHVAQGVVQAPDWVSERCKALPEKTAAHDVQLVHKPDVTTALIRAFEFLQQTPPAIQGEGGDTRTYHIAARLKDFGLDQDSCLAAMASIWNPRCQPPWAIQDLQTKIEHAYRYGVNPVGADAPENAFHPVVNGANLSPVQQLNREYAYVLSGGGQHVLWETTDALNRPKLEHLTLDAFHGKFAAKKLHTADKALQVSKLWFVSDERRSYDGLVFQPEQAVPPRFYNLWKGFAYPYAETGAHPMVQRFLDHAFHNVCRGNTELYQWLIGYFAHMIQKPWEKPLVALVFKGAKGVGKNALIERVGALLGPHFMVSASRRYLVGNFNGHLERLLLFVLDEAFWSGDKLAEGVLKDLVTGSEHLIERKGHEPYAVANKTRICIIGNEEWLVPASYDERRFAVFDVGEGRKQDTRYFTEMREGLESTGYPHLLTFFKQYRITTDVNVAPHTAALGEQKYQSLDVIGQWWLDCLTEGRIVGSYATEWEDSVDCDDVRMAVRQYVRHRNIQSRLPDDRNFGRQLMRYTPTCERVRSSVTIDGKRPYVYKFGPLDAVRAQWATFIGHDMAW